VIKHKSTRRRAPLLWRKSDLKIKKRIDKLYSKKINRKKQTKLLNNIANLEFSGNLEKQRQGYDAFKYAKLKYKDKKYFKKTK
tara:strand:+ start:69 stop:317 length:249 start_codon:yes stop_codon:yes gene_type:complete